jgi:GrpB-like predicted nucleotidyltransferase (UPF0157 family)
VTNDAPADAVGALAARLRAAGIDPGALFGAGASPWEIWLRLRERYGRRVTLIDLYQLEAMRQDVPVAALPAADRARLRAAALPVIFPGFTENPGTSRASEGVEVAGYDPGWPRQFGRWRDRLAAALGATAVRIEHVGSTSVPGLAAKPVIDVQVSVTDISDEESYVPAIGSAGFVLRSREDAHRFFRPPAAAPREAQVHVCLAGGRWERDHLLFRDYLRARPAARDQYGELKRGLAAVWHDDRTGYTEAKTGFILDTLDDAEQWAAAAHWRP